jgi:HAD superfamily hydrolase (TIGR01509 family)
VAAIVFDLDGVLIDSEGMWNAARAEVAKQFGGRWPPDAPRAMMGMSSTEWSSYMHEELGVTLSGEEISEEVVSRLMKGYSERVPLIPGAREAVARCAQEWPLGLASSANRPIITLVLERSGLKQYFAVTVASEEVPRGKPSPDVYLEAARRMDEPPERCAAVEDSSNGLRSAAAAGMMVFAVPNREFPPDDDALTMATEVLDSIAELTPERVRAAAVSAA